MDLNTSKPATENTTPPFMQRGNIHNIEWTKVAVVIAGLLIFMGIAFYLGHKWPVRILDNGVNSTNTVATTSSNEKAANAATNPYKGWHTYTNHVYGYSFKYPDPWQLQNNANDITLSSSANGDNYTIMIISSSSGGRDVAPDSTKTAQITCANQACTETTYYKGYKPILIDVKPNKPTSAFQDIQMSLPETSIATNQYQTTFSEILASITIL